MAEADTIGVGRSPEIEQPVAAFVVSPDEALRGNVRCPSTQLYTVICAVYCIYNPCGEHNMSITPQVPASNPQITHLVSSSTSIIEGSSPSGIEQSGSRCSIKESSVPRGMEASPRCGAEDMAAVR